MRVGGVFHPDFFYSPRRTTGTSQLAHVRVWKLTPNSGDWVPGGGMNVTPDELIWESRGRVQPNIDWRARPREVQFEYDAVQAVRVQLPIGKNLIGAVWDEDKKRYTSYGPDPEFIKDMRVEIVDGPVKGFETMEGRDLFVRNAISSQNLWLHNLLCDVKTGGSIKV